MNPMFKLTGRVEHVFESPRGVNKSTGEEYGGDWKVQIIGDIPLPNGQCRRDIVDIKTDQGEVLKGSIGKIVTAPVSFYAVGKSVGYYVPKGHKFSIQSNT